MHKQFEDRIQKAKYVLCISSAVNHVDAIKKVASFVSSGAQVFEVSLAQNFGKPSGLELLKKLKATYPSALIGAGSIADLETLKDALYAGASFFVSPHSDSRLIDFALAEGLFYIPGAATATELMSLKNKGFSMQNIYTGKNMAAYQLADLLLEMPSLSVLMTIKADDEQMARAKANKLIDSGAKAIRIEI